MELISLFLHYFYLLIINIINLGGFSAEGTKTHECYTRMY